MTYFHPAWLEHQRKRFTRADAWRLAPPGTPEAKPPGYLHPSAHGAKPKGPDRRVQQITANLLNRFRGSE